MEHYRRVRGLVPNDSLLEYDIHEGWAPLCEFFFTAMIHSPLWLEVSKKLEADWQCSCKGRIASARNARVRRHNGCLARPANAKVAICAGGE